MIYSINVGEISCRVPAGTYLSGPPGIPFGVSSQISANVPREHPDISLTVSEFLLEVSDNSSGVPP